MATSAGAVYVDVKANTQPFQQSMGGLGNLASKFGGIVSKALSVAALAKFGAECTNVASRLTEVQNVVDQVFPHMNAQVDAWSRNLIDAFGLSETKAKEYVGTLGSMARSMGFTEKQAYDMSTSMAELAGDVASFYDMSADEAYEKLQSVFTGMVQPLRALGINMTQASLDAFALANGFGKSVSEMSEAERALLRYQFVLDRTKYAQGDFARTNQSWANQLRILSMRFEELKIAVGNSLIVALAPVIQVINTIIAALTAAANAFYRFISAIANTGIGRFAKAAGKAIGGLAGRSGEAAESTSALADAQNDAAGAAGAQNAAQAKLNRTLAGFDRINKLTAQSSAGGGGGGGGGIGGISDAFDALGAAEDTTLDLQAALDSLELPPKLLSAFERLSDVLGDIKRHVSNGLAWAWENVLKPLGEWTINEAAPAVINLLAEALAFLDEVAVAISPVLEWLYEHIIKPLATWIGEKLVLALQDAAEWFKLFATFVRVYVNPAIKKFVGFLDRVLEDVKELLGITSSGKGGGGSFSIGGGKGFGGGFDQRTGVTDSDGVTRWTHRGKGGALEDVPGAFYFGTKPLRQFVKLWDGVKDKTPKLTAKVKETPTKGLEKTSEKFASIKNKTAVLKARVSDYTGTSGRQAIDRWHSIKTKTETLTLNANDYASSKIDAVNAKSLNNHWSNLTANDYASGKIQEVNRKTLQDHSADLKFTPVLTKRTIRMTGGGGQITLQAYAQGGYVERNTPRLAIIGDNKREGEYIAPESKMRAMAEQAAAGAGGADLLPVLTSILAAVQSIDPDVYLDGQAITRKVVSNVNAQTRATGRCGILV